MYTIVFPSQFLANPQVSQTFDDKQALNFYKLFCKNVVWLDPCLLDKKGKERNKDLLGELYMNDIILRVWSQLVEFEAKRKKSSFITLLGNPLLNFNNIDSNNKYLITNLIKQSQNIPYSITSIYVNMHCRFANFFKYPTLKFVVTENNQNTILNQNSKILIYLNKVKPDYHLKMQEFRKMNYNSYLYGERKARLEGKKRV